MKKLVTAILVLVVIVFITLSIKEIKGNENEIRCFSPPRYIRPGRVFNLGVSNRLYIHKQVTGIRYEHLA